MEGVLRDHPNPGVFDALCFEEMVLLEVLRNDRAAQRLNLSSKKRRRQHQPPEAVELPPFLTNFAEVLRLSPPPAPPALLKSLAKKDSFCIGKVKVMLRIKGDSSEAVSFLNVDGRKKQVTVHELTNGQSSTPERRAGVSAPKMFAFDAIFPPDDTQAEVCSGSLPDVIQAVVGGTDGCLFVYGHSKLGKTHTMVGSSESPQSLGVMPCAISWLFRLIHEQRQRTGARFSVRVSALELTGRNELLRDLLSEYAAGTEGSGTSPGVYLRDDPIFGAQLINQSELRAPTAEKAAYLLDAALAARSRDGDDEGRNSHFLFTLHLYQYRVERQGKGGVAGGRSRLHLFDLGSCDKICTKPRDGGCLSLSALGNVILALFNGQKHVPYKESKLTQLLKEAMSSLTCRVAMIAHISSQPCHFSEILGTLQLASRVHRMRRKKIKYPNVPLEDEKGCVRPFVRMHAEDNVKSGSSDPDYTSSSEQSCDTVIFVGHLAPPDHPPASLPIVPKQQQKLQQQQGGSSSLERKRKNSVSKEDAKKKGSPLVSRHQPASTQTQQAEAKSAQNSPMRKTKHNRTKQDQGTSVEMGKSAAKGGVVGAKAMQSDETWIDGPRFAKPKFDSKTLHRLQKEQWVDGPPNVYGFMDHHKQDMIQRWIDEHSRQQQQQAHGAKKRGGEVWIDHPKKREHGRTAADSPPQQQKVAVPTSADDGDSASNSADVDETDNEENAEASGDSDLHILQIAQSEAAADRETIEVYEPEEPVPTVDCGLQVTEEDILAEYWLLRRRHPPLDQSSSCDSGEHPLRVLSEEDLNLPSSFTTDSRVSVDLDSISVPDGEGAVTWRLLYGNMFQRIKEQQRQQSTDRIDDKLERIAKLRELIQPLTRHRSQTKVDSIFKTCPVSRSGSRFTMPDMADRSEESSVEDLSAAEVTSIHSEPADLDHDKFDYKLNIKPMNGLKLEAFYRKIQKVPPFLEQYSSLKPTQVVPPLSYEQEKLYLVSRLENQRSESETIINKIGGYKQPNSTHSNYYKLNIAGSEADERDLMKDAISSMKQTCSSFSIHNNSKPLAAKLSSSENTIPTKLQQLQTPPPPELVDNSTNVKKPVEKREHKKDDKRTLLEPSKRTKGVDPSLLTVGQSPSNKPRLRKVKNGGLEQSSSSSLWSKDSSKRSSGRSPKCPPAPSSKAARSKPPTGCCSAQCPSGLLCRSTSSPSTCEYRLSPYQVSSSGHGSESSGNAVVKTTQQFSGTSSGYESMLRDSEGTPLSSSQESGNEDSIEGRGRRGRRKSNGSSKRSSSAPARSPPSPLGPSPPAPAIHQQPLGGGGRACRRGGDRSALHRSDEEVCCTSLLCCRLLDFY